MKVWTILAAMISTTMLADQPAVAPAATTNAVTPEVLAAPAHDATAAKHARKKAAKTAAKPAPAAELRTTPLIPGPAVVAANRVNVRGRAGLAGEVVTRLTNGEPVTVLEEVTLKHSKADEPSAWAKIVLPSSVHVWVHSSYIDKTAMTVKATKLNLRGGPGENFSVLGTLQNGDAVKELSTKGDWMEIEAPASAYAFVAAQYLKQEAPAIVSNVVPPVEPAPEPAPTTTTTVADNQVVAPSTEIPPVTPAATNDIAAIAPTNDVSAVAEPVVTEEPAPPRIVQREGLVRSTMSIQAPTKYELVSPDNFRAINYLYTTSTNLDLSRYKGLHIIVTGEEGLDDRWKNTPVITIQQIRVIE